MKRRARDRKAGKPALIRWLPRPVAIVPGSSALILGIDMHEAKGAELLAFWTRESQRRGIDREHKEAA
jgi:hypothetical protein